MKRRDFTKGLAALFAAPQVLLDKQKEVEGQFEFPVPKNLNVPKLEPIVNKIPKLPRVVSAYDRRWTLIESAEPLHLGDLVAINKDGKAVRVGADSQNVFGVVITGGLSTAIVEHW